MSRRISLIGASTAAALTCLAFAGVASAGVSTYSGTMPNGGCDGTRAVTVSGPSRIEGEVASTKSADPALVYIQILSPGGNVVAQNRYDTPGGGTYYVQACSYYDQISPPSLPFEARYATGPAGQPALPPAQATGGVLGATTVLSRSVHGTGAINTRYGLTWFTIKKSANDLGIVKVFDAKHHRHYMFTRALIRFTANGVRFVQGNMTLTIAQTANGERISFRSAKLKTGGKVIRGSFLIV